MLDHPAHIYPSCHVREEHAREDYEGQRDVDQQPRHLLAGDRVQQECGDRPIDQKQAESVAPSQEVDDTDDADEEGQKLVHGGRDEVVVPRLPAASLALLDNPVPEGLPDAALDAPVEVRQERRVQQRPDRVEDQRASPPHRPVPPVPEICGESSHAYHDQEGDNVAAAQGFAYSCTAVRRGEHQFGPAQQHRILEDCAERGPLRQGDGYSGTPQRTPVGSGSPGLSGVLYRSSIGSARCARSPRVARRPGSQLAAALLPNRVAQPVVSTTDRECQPADRLTLWLRKPARAVRRRCTGSDPGPRPGISTYTSPGRKPTPPSGCRCAQTG